MSPTRVPLPIVVGSGRSGTTLVWAILNAHSEIALPPESWFVAEFLRRRAEYERPNGFASEKLVSALVNRGHFQKWDLSATAVRDALEPAPSDLPDAIRRIYALYASERGKCRYGDKTPGYVMSLPLLATAFPEARFVHVIRDGRDVAASFLKRSFGPSTVTEAAFHWRGHVQTGRRQGRLLGRDRYHELSYERLIEDPEYVVGELCQFLDLGYQPEMLRYYEKADDLRRVAPNQEKLAQPPTPSAGWRANLSPEEVARFELVAGDALTDFGYELASRRPRRGRDAVARHSLSLLIKLSSARRKRWSKRRVR